MWALKNYIETPQSEAKCKPIDVKIMFYSHAIKLISTRKAYALSLVLKVRVLNSKVADYSLLDFSSPRSSSG